MTADKLLLGAGNAVARIVRMWDRLGNRSLGGQRVYGPQGAGVREGWVRVEGAGSWIWFRNYLRRKKVGEEVTLFVNVLMFALDKMLALGFRHRKAHILHYFQSYQNAYPASLETVLRTEEAVRAALQTCGTLQGACVVRAVHTPAFAIRDFSHDFMANLVLGESNSRNMYTKVD